MIKKLLFDTRKNLEPLVAPSLAHDVIRNLDICSTKIALYFPMNTVGYLPFTD